MDMYHGLLLISSILRPSPSLPDMTCSSTLISHGYLPAACGVSRLKIDTQLKQISETEVNIKALFKN